MLNPKVAIVISVYNRIKYTLECLHSLGNVDYDNHIIIVVDDGSNDNTCEIIAKQFPQVVIIKGDGSLWWSKATNIGISQALDYGAEYILILNNDDEVDNDIIKNMLGCAFEYPNSIVAAKVRDFHHPDTIVFAGSHVDWKNKGTYRIGAGEIDKGQYDQRRDIDWIPGAGTFIDRHIIERIGLLDHKAFPQYGADIDYTLRARNAGFRIIFEPTAVIWKKLESTGIFSSDNRMSLKMLYMSLISLKSSVNIKRQVRLLWRHCPPKYIFRQLFNTYSAFYRGLIADILRHHITLLTKRH